MSQTNNSYQVKSDMGRWPYLVNAMVGGSPRGPAGVKGGWALVQPLTL